MPPADCPSTTLRLVAHDLDSLPAPVVPRIPQRKQSLDKGNRTRSKSGTASRHGSAHGAARTGSRGRTIEELLYPDESGLDELDAPVPVQNPHEGRHYEHYTLEEERTEPRDSPQSRGQRSHRFSFIPGRATPGTLSDITALPTVRRYRDEEEPSYSRLATELYSLSYLIIFSILGTLARLGVQWLTYYPGAPSIFPVLWANFGGTLFMGFLSQDQRIFRSEWGNRPPTPPQTPIPDEEKAMEQAARASSHAKVKKTIPLYIGLATGFCGSFTSFSSFIRDVFLAFVNDLRAPDVATPVRRNDGYSFMAGLAVIVITIAVCFAALKVGAHIAILLDRLTPTLPFRFTRKIIDPAIAFIAWSAWLGAIVMAIFPPDRPSGPSSKGPWSHETWRGQAIFACVFAPAGCLLRFYVSLKLNPLIPSFPLGTFCVNIFGTAVLGMAYDLQHVDISGSGIGGGRVGCQILQGVMDGFDGCLTTVSTWILEIESLKRGHAWKYGFASVAAGVAVLVMVMGSVRWSVGWTAAGCVT
ncbi:hypothetical protein N0V90_010840 [Kalmusia sp. IMI 367209]|nr:hypothetical protein N0V90_010840 [Kalmusia sp. IMI 367209]